MSIVIGTDFTELAARAAEIAGRLCRKLGEDAIVVHAVDPMALPEGGSTPILDDAAERLSRAAARLRELGVETLEELQIGAAHDVLAEIACRRRARLVVVGALPHPSVSRWAVGSIAERAARRCTVPVLLARHGEALVRWLEGDGALRVAVGVDLSAASDGALRWAASLRAAGPVEIVAIHVYFPPAEIARLGLEGGPADEAVTREAVLRDMSAQVVAVPEMGDVRLVARASQEQTPLGLIEAAEQERADILVVGVHRRRKSSWRWYSSVSQGTLHLAPMTVVAVPAERERAGAKAIPEIHEVLAPTDMSELGDLGVPHAYGLPGRGGIVHLLYVHPLAERPSPEESARLEEALQERIPPGANLRGVVTEVSVVHGSEVGTAICQAAERFGVDAICMSSHGRRGAPRVLLGSVAEDVVRRSRRPVLIVRAGETS